MTIETDIRLCPVCQDRMPADVGQYVVAEILERGDDGHEISAGLDFVCSRECAEQGGRPAIDQAVKERLEAEISEERDALDREIAESLHAGLDDAGS